MSDAPIIHVSRGPAHAAAWLLAAAGTLPFLAGVVDAIALERAWLDTVHVYAAIIASFICGIHWGVALFAPERLAPRLFVLSNVLALLAWLAALLPPGPGFLLLGAIFAALLLVDAKLWRSGLLPGWFWHLRAAITAVVVAACIAIGAMA